MTPRLLNPLLKVVTAFETVSIFCAPPLLIGPLNTKLPEAAEPSRVSVEMEIEFVIVRVLASDDSKVGNNPPAPRQSWRPVPRTLSAPSTIVPASWVTVPVIPIGVVMVRRPVPRLINVPPVPTTGPTRVPPKFWLMTRPALLVTAPGMLSVVP